MCWNDNRKLVRSSVCIYVGISIIKLPKSFLYELVRLDISCMQILMPAFPESNQMRPRNLFYMKNLILCVLYIMYIYMFSCDKLYRFSRSIGDVGRWTHCCWKLPLVSIKTIQKPCQHRKPMGLTPSVILRGHVCGLFFLFLVTIFLCLYHIQNWIDLHRMLALKICIKIM